MSSRVSVPFLDLISPHAELENELVDVFRRAIRSAGFIGGPVVEQFEREFAEFCEANHCVGVGSGTDALRFALVAAGVKAGDAVITVPNTFIATTEAISQAGATPVFVDIKESTFTLDPDQLRALLENECSRDPRTGSVIHKRTGKPVTAVVPVHLYGSMADMDPILELAERYNLAVIEDACQAHGAEYFSNRQKRWFRAGSMGRAAAFSFYPGKNLGACGEGGAITTNDEQLAKQCRMLRDHGSAKKYFHDVEGYNGRLDAIQAGILSVKLKHLARWNAQRSEIARRYLEMLNGIEGLVLPSHPATNMCVYHLFVVRVADRERLQADLAAVGVSTQIHYPVPLHLQKAYEGLGYSKGSFPVTEAVSVQILSLPMYPQLTAEQQAAVVNALTAHLADRALV